MALERNITSKQIREILGSISDMTLWRYLKDPYLNFPKPIYIKRRRYWQETEIIRWLESQKQSSSQQPAE